MDQGIVKGTVAHLQGGLYVGKEWLKSLGHWRPELKMEHFIVVGTLGTGALLYTNYHRICLIKERRKMQLRKATMMPFSKGANPVLNLCEDESSLQSRKKTDTDDSRNIFVRIWTLGGLFESREKVDKLLSYIWIPSIPRGLGFWKVRKRKHQPVWHYGELTGMSFTGPEGITVAPVEETRLPTHMDYLGRAIYVFGQWSLDQVLSLNDSVEYFPLSEGEELFKTEEMDFNIYIVLSGHLHLIFQCEDGKEHVIKSLRPGDQLMSLLVFLDFILDNIPNKRCVQAVAQTESEIMRISMADIVRVFIPTKADFSSLVKRVVRRTYSVVFTACHNILGLTAELFSAIPRDPPNSLENIQPLQKPSQKVIDEAAAKLMAVLSVTDPKLVADCTCIVVPIGFVISEAGQLRSKEVVFVSEGELEVVMKPLDADDIDSDPPVPFYVSAGGFFGVLAMLTDEARHFNVQASAPSILVVVPTGILTKLMEDNSTVFHPLVNSVFSHLSPLARQLDYGIEWAYYESGEPLFHADDEALATYLVLTGRLRSYISRRNRLDSSSMLSEFGKYDFVGLPEMWANRRRSKTVLAIRDSEIAKIPMDFLLYLCRRFNKVPIQILQFLTRRMVGSYKIAAEDSPDSTFNRSTYALFPTHPDVPVAYLAREFEEQFDQYETIIKVDSSLVRKQLGYYEDDETIDPGLLPGLIPWLAFLESTYTKILYVADYEVNVWSKKCFHEADMIFIAVNSDGDKEISNIEKMITGSNSLAKKELWICHKYQAGFPYKAPRYTKFWLQNRPWLSFHHQLYVSSRYYDLNVDQVRNLGREHFGRNVDMGRIVRWLTGNSFGVALGGGGAKGAAHIGFIREFSKTLLPIDMICGVSIGSFIGALLAIFQDIDKVEMVTRQWFDTLVHGQKFLLDLTLPYVAVFTGEAINHTLIEIFGDTQIEDMRIPFFTCTTDLTSNSIREHRCGSLWRYVRASMTLISFFPPVCDPRDGHYLIDGGYTNLVPADIMKNIGIRYILAIDISSKPSTDRFTDYGDSISGVDLFSHFSPIPRAHPITAPSTAEIQARLNWAQSVVYINLVKKMEQMQEAASEIPSVVYLRLPIDFYATNDFNRFDNMRNIGNEFATRVLEHISPGDSIQVIWKKLRINRGAQSVTNQQQNVSVSFSTAPSVLLFKAKSVNVNVSKSTVDLNLTSLLMYGTPLVVSNK